MASTTPAEESIESLFTAENLEELLTYLGDTLHHTFIADEETNTSPHSEPTAIMRYFKHCQERPGRWGSSESRFYIGEMGWCNKTVRPMATGMGPMAVAVRTMKQIAGRAAEEIKAQAEKCENKEDKERMKDNSVDLKEMSMYYADALLDWHFMRPR